MQDLIERLGKATGPDRSLSLDIWKCCHPDREVMGVWSANGMQFICNHDAYTKERFEGACRNAKFREPPQHKDYCHHDELKDYTASIDAALTLLPEGWTRAVDATAPELGIDVTLFPPDDTAEVKGTHDLESVATCIAAIRARSN